MCKWELQTTMNTGSMKLLQTRLLNAIVLHISIALDIFTPSWLRLADGIRMDEEIMDLTFESLSCELTRIKNDINGYRGNHQYNPISAGWYRESMINFVGNDIEFLILGIGERSSLIWLDHMYTSEVGWYTGLLKIQRTLLLLLTLHFLPAVFISKCCPWYHT